MQFASILQNATKNATHPALKYQDVLIGSILCIGGNLLISVSLNIQKYVHMRIESSQVGEHYMRIPMWWLGIFLMVLGETGNFTAYGFAPASMVAPLGTTTVIANMIIAVIFLHEVMRPEDLFGSVLAIIGAFLIVSYSKANHPVQNGAAMMARIGTPIFIAYFVIAVTALIVLLVAYYVFKYSNVLVLLLLTNVLASFTVISAKGVSALFQLTVSGVPQWKYPIFYIMFIVLCATAVLQVIFLNKAMKSNYSTVVVPTNFVFFTIAAIIGGVVFFNEFSGLHALDIFMFLLGCVLSFVGVFFIQFNRVGERPPEAEDSEEGAELITKRRRSKPFADGLPAWLTATRKSTIQPSGDRDYRLIDSLPPNMRRSLPNLYSFHLRNQPVEDPEEHEDREDDRILSSRPTYGAM